MKDFLARHAAVLLCCLAAIVCTGLYGCETRYYLHVDRYHRVMVLDRWTGRIDQR